MVIWRFLENTYPCKRCWKVTRISKCCKSMYYQAHPGSAFKISAKENRANCFVFPNSCAKIYLPKFCEFRHNKKESEIWWKNVFQFISSNYFIEEIGKSSRPHLWKVQRWCGWLWKCTWMLPNFRLSGNTLFNID